MAAREPHRARRGVAAFAVAWVALAGVAAADITTVPDGHGTVTGTGSATSDGRVEVELTGQRRRSGGSGGAVRRTVGQWVSYPAGYCTNDGRQWLGFALGPVNPGDVPFRPDGEILAMTLVLPDGNVTRTQLWNECERRPRPTAPPSAESALAAANLPTTSVPTSPEVTGLVGMENWFWYEGPTTLTVNVELDGWTGTAVARAVEWHWDFGDGASASSTTPGSPDDPAVTHTYTVQGTNDIVLTVTWEADFTFTGFGAAVQTGLGTIDFPSGTRSYVVEEREAVVVE